MQDDIMLLLTCVAGRHNLVLVGCAAAICVMTAVTTSWLLPSVRTSLRGWMLAVLVLSMGSWTMHFVAMLGFEPEVLMFYDPDRTAGSALVALTGVFVGFGWWRFTTGVAGAGAAGAVIGSAVTAMHYLGMQAVSLPGSLAFDPLMVAASSVAAVGFGAAALGVRPLLSWQRARGASALLLLLCLVSLHSIGMAAVTVDKAPQLAPNGLARLWLALITAAGSVAICGGLVAFVVLGTISARRRGIRDARRLRELAEASFEALAICDGAGKVVDANTQLTVLCGSNRDALLGRHVQSLFEPGSPPIGREGVGLAKMANGVPVETQSRVVGKGGTIRSVVALRDVRERVKAEQRIHHMAHHDALTGLVNRVLFSERLLLEIARARRSNSAFALLCVDLDRFKPVNDVYGHATGDALLRQVADRLRAELRNEDTVARLGGDEFAIILSGLNLADTGRPLALARRLLERISAPYDLGDVEASISCSIGLAMFPDDAVEADALLRGADMALYRAKQGGRATFAFFRPDMEDALRDRHMLEQELRLSIGRGEMSLAWQPQATSAGTDVIGFEALLRWRHPARGDISPDLFIPLAESTGFILQLGSWAMQTACREAASWSNKLRVGVNVSPIQVQQPDFPEIVAEVLRTTGLDPERLELEVTETLFLSEVERVLLTLQALKRMGVRVSLDDFGTGYSSLGMLRRFPFDRIKLDRSFVSRMTEDVQSAAIVQAILELSRGLGLPVVAEGVETTSQLGALRAARCEEIQGFLIGRPRPISWYADLVGDGAGRPWPGMVQGLITQAAE